MSWRRVPSWKVQTTPLPMHNVWMMISNTWASLWGGGLVRGDIPYGDDLVGILWGAPNMCKGFGNLQNLLGDGSEVDDPTLAVDVAISKLAFLPLTHPRPS